MIQLILFFSMMFSLEAAEILPMKSSVHAYVLRLGPGQDPKLALLKFVREKKIKAASIASAVGSLTVSLLRYANQKDSIKIEGHREVVSLSGTLGETSGSHLA